ncbi:pilus assembly protein [Vibrio sp.]|uniref:pilus assembly protein n=1 Tax=Vibrio sp. TaxID=678 RepID=UPI003D0E9AA6
MGYILTSFFIVFALIGTSQAEDCTAPDYYFGDSSIYVGDIDNTSIIKPNVLFFIDTSSEMANIGTTGLYENEEGSSYTGAYNPDEIYYKQSDTYKTKNLLLGDLDYEEAEDRLYEYGSFVGCIGSQGAVCTNKTESYYTGDYLNWKEINTTASEWQASTDYEIDDIVYKAGADPNSQVYKCIDVADSNNDTVYSSGIEDPFPENPDINTNYSDGELTWQPQLALVEVVANELKALFSDSAYLLLDKVNIGLMIYNSNSQGGAVTLPIIDRSASTLSEIYDALEKSLDEDVVPAAHAAAETGNPAQPVGGALWDAWLYWVGDPDGGAPYTITDIDDGNHANSTANDNADLSMPPIDYWCQPNHIFYIGTGASEDTMGTSNPIAAMDSSEALGPDADDGYYSPEAANYLYNSLDRLVSDTQAKVNTNVIQLMTPSEPKLENTARQGRGAYVHVTDSNEIREAITDALLGILEADSSYVAPVVPASPENRAYSGQRIYLGFFKPMNDEPWFGNLKKFGLSPNNEITAFDGDGDETLATNSGGYFRTTFNDDLIFNNDGTISVDESVDPTLDGGDPLVGSFWGTALDGGVVNEGGVGALLKTHISNRNIYTYTGSSSDLKSNENAFSIDNGSTLREIDSSLSDALIKYVQGYDAFAQFSTDTTQARPWILGDIMHSKPVVLNYIKYPFSNANEAKDDWNKGYVFVGANDGMLHAFRDATGEEAWAFIPPDLLPNLKYLADVELGLSTQKNHYYFVDGSPVVYVYDADGDGNILPLPSDHPDYDTSDTSDDNDKAILICGMRRGGGTCSLTPDTTQGAYFALDISDPENPQYLWSINSNSTGFSEMAQTWSTPRLTKIRVHSGENTVTKVAAIITGGYDTNEDLRYGAKDLFPATGDPNEEGEIDRNTSDKEDGSNGTSLGSADPYIPGGRGHGRGIFIVEIATLENGVPNFSNSGTLIESFVHTESNHMDYCIPSDPLVIDTNQDGYAERIYVGDTGGQLWRVNISPTLTEEGTTVEDNWSATRIFKANPGADNSAGRKIFYKPTATISGDDTFIYFGTGDREHPLNTEVVDRFYVIRDREVGSNTWDYSTPLSENNLVDVTEYDISSDNQLRLSSDNLYASSDNKTYYGWYMRLLSPDSSDIPTYEQRGEKVLATPKVFEGTIFFSTYEPLSYESGDDPCVGKLGKSRSYAIDSLTGQAVFNFSDYDPESWDNPGDDELTREDRSLEIGYGIASEPLIMVNSKGSVSVLVGRGGGFFNTGQVNSVDPVFPVYWMKW